jgi:hypothetical protein
MNNFYLFWLSQYENSSRKKEKKHTTTLMTHVYPGPLVLVVNIFVVRASPRVLSMWLQTVQFIVKKSKCAGSAHEIGFSGTKFVQIPWLVKGATQRCTSKEECNKLDLTAAQYFWLVDHKIGPGSLLLIIPTYMQFQFQFYWWGCPKKNLNLDI